MPRIVWQSERRSGLPSDRDTGKEKTPLWRRPCFQEKAEKFSNDARLELQKGQWKPIPRADELHKVDFDEDDRRRMHTVALLIPAIGKFFPDLMAVRLKPHVN
ncbi:hypothetical protein MRX96_012636 [Rhipicephalus microplus]